MAGLITIFIIIASILLVAVVFIQNPKGGGLSSDFGAAHQMGGVQRTNDFIEKATWSLAGGVMVLSIVLTIMLKPETPKVPEGGKPGQEQGTGGQKAPGNAGNNGGAQQ